MPILPSPSASSTLPSFRLQYLFISLLFSESLGQMPKTGSAGGEDAWRQMERTLVFGRKDGGRDHKEAAAGRIPPAANLGPPCSETEKKTTQRTFLIYSDKVVPSSVRSFFLSRFVRLRQNRNKLPRGRKLSDPPPRVHPSNSEEARTAPISLPRSLNIFRLFAALLSSPAVRLRRGTHAEKAYPLARSLLLRASI